MELLQTRSSYDSWVACCLDCHLTVWYHFSSLENGDGCPCLESERRSPGVGRPLRCHTARCSRQSVCLSVAHVHSQPFAEGAGTRAVIGHDPFQLLLCSGLAPTRVSTGFVCALCRPQEHVWLSSWRGFLGTLDIAWSSCKDYCLTDVALYAGIESVVKSTGGVSSFFSFNKGLRQG